MTQQYNFIEGTEENDNLESTSAVSTIWGIAFGETKLPKSIVSNPHRNKDCMYCTFLSVGIKSLMPCMASLGHSIIFTFSVI